MWSVHHQTRSHAHPGPMWHGDGRRGMDGKWEGSHHQTRDHAHSGPMWHGDGRWGWTVSGKAHIIKPETTPIQVQCDMVMDGEGWTVSGRCSSFNPRPRPSKSNIYRLLTKYREICPTAVVVRQRPELARAWVRTTIKGGHISRYLIKILFIVYPCFSTFRFRLMNLKFIYSKPNNNHILFKKSYA